MGSVLNKFVRIRSMIDLNSNYNFAEIVTLDFNLPKPTPPMKTNLF